MIDNSNIVNNNNFAIEDGYKLIKVYVVKAFLDTS